MRIPAMRLAVLSACETAIQGVILPDEAISLPMGLLQAGVAGVVASLWSVEYISTMMLMIRFYDLWRREHVSPVEALRRAQQWMKGTSASEKLAYFEHYPAASSQQGLPPDRMDALYQAAFFSMPPHCDHPFYWAAFNYTGI